MQQYNGGIRHLFLDERGSFPKIAEVKHFGGNPKGVTQMLYPHVFSRIFHVPSCFPQSTMGFNGALTDSEIATS